MLKKEIAALRAALKESYSDYEDMEPEEIAALEPIDPTYGTLRYEAVSAEDARGYFGGTHKVGEVSADFKTVCEKFGDPEWNKYTKDEYDGGWAVTYVEWYIEFADNVYATLYDWKISGSPRDNNQWVVGGKSYDVAARIDRILKGGGKRTR